MTESHLEKIALGGGCHWCTEAVFQSLIGVEHVEQGYVASKGKASRFSEAVIVHFNPETISEHVLIAIHLHTHKSTSAHSRRDTYRSAVYVFKKEQEERVLDILNQLQPDFEKPLITEILSFNEFKPSRKAIRNYYFNNPEKPFCEQFINPKLRGLIANFSKYLNDEKIKHLK